MIRVVERCATCGVEHEARADECEACGGALRYWCRAHSRELGWLESAACRGCVEESVRPMPRPRPAPLRPHAVPASPRRSVPPVPRAATPAERRVVYAPMPAHVWVEMHVRATLGAVLWTTIICAILSAGWVLSHALRRGMDVSDALVDGTAFGAVMGVFVGIGTACVRLRWLKRPGGPLDARYRP
jgi:hypothetical protein